MSLELDDQAEAVATNTTVQMIPVDAIVRGGYNPNGRIQGPAYDEFREDVRKRGVLQAVLVREAEDGEKPEGQRAFFLIAGHRRVQAAIDTMLDSIPAVVIASEPGSDEELRLIENIQRAELDPVSEAEALSAMIREFGADGPEEIATRVGKSLGHVRRRLSLLRVSKKVLEAVRAGELPVRVAELVGSVDDAKLRAKACEEALSFTWERRPATVSEMRTWLADKAGHDLAGAPWDQADEQLYTGDPCRGACQHCPFNTANQGELFGDVGKEAACMSSEGWAAKTKAYFDRRSAQVKAAGGTVLSSVEAKALARGNSAGRYAKAADVCHQDSRYRTFGELAGKDLGVRAIGLVNGEVVDAVDTKAVVAAAKERGVQMRSSSVTGGYSASPAEKKQKEKNKRERSTVALAMEKVVAAAEGRALTAKWVLQQLARELGSEQARTMCIRRGWVPEKKTGKGMGGWSPREVVRERAAELTEAQSAGAVIEILATPPYPGSITGIVEACGFYGVNWERLLKDAEAAHDGKAKPEKKAKPAKASRAKRAAEPAPKVAVPAKVKRTKRVARKSLIKKTAKKGRRR